MPSSDYEQSITSLIRRVAQEGRDTVCSETEISPNTLTDITSGNLPWLRDDWAEKRVSTKKRTQRLWAKSLTRIAAYVQEPVEKWLRACHLDHADEGIASVVAEQQEEIEKKTGRPVASDVLSVIHYNNNEVDVELFKYHPFCEGDNDREGFFWTMSDRIIRSINPEFAPRTEVESELSVLLRDDGPQLIVGVFDTVYRRFKGFDFLPIRGWEVRLSAVTVAPALNDNGDSAASKNATEAPTWNDIVQPELAESKRVRALVVDGEVGYLFLKSHLGDFYKSEGPTKKLYKNTVLSSYPDHINTLLNLRDKQPNNQFVFVADEYSCRHLVQLFNDRTSPDGARRDGLRAQLVDGHPWEFPNYQLAIGSPSGGSFEQSRWFHLLGDALETEIYGSAYIQTAIAYGDLMVRAINEDGFDFEDIPSGSRPSFFWLKVRSRSEPEKTRHFWDRVYESVFRAIDAFPSMNSASDKLHAAIRMLPRDADEPIVIQLLRNASKVFMACDEQVQVKQLRETLDCWAKSGINKQHTKTFELLIESLERKGRD